MVCSKERLDLDEVALKGAETHVGFAVLASVGALRRCHLAFSKTDEGIYLSLQTGTKC